MKYLFLVLFWLMGAGLYAQDSVSVVQTNEVSNPVPTEVATPTLSATPVRMVSSYEFALSISTLVFGLLVLAMGMYILVQKKASFENAIRFITITLIISSTLFLITAGYSNDQLAPALGLLGTIAGYLLGKNQNDKDDEKEK